MNNNILYNNNCIRLKLSYSCYNFSTIIYIIFYVFVFLYFLHFMYILHIYIHLNLIFTYKYLQSSYNIINSRFESNIHIFII